ncbi:hypothetical protein BpHYR1_040018 [Brachionus plicatilis]|uniref:Uncharacterized protein n=1 Tax=Brachionus plicatilis TaxID=10195 RepID=A0A3M7T1J6_BRAPC|nr:hypothetical protein BpHYR1_040018 [Brachionus plicatilis]
MRIFGEINSIQEDLLDHLPLLKFIILDGQNARKLFNKIGINWIKKLNKKIHINSLDYAKVYNQTNKIAYLMIYYKIQDYVTDYYEFFEPIFNLNNTFPDEDFCIYKDFPFDQLVHIYFDLFEYNSVIESNQSNEQANTAPRRALDWNKIWEKNEKEEVIFLAEVSRESKTKEILNSSNEPAAVSNIFKPPTKQTGRDGPINQATGIISGSANNPQNGVSGRGRDTQDNREKLKPNQPRQSGYDSSISTADDDSQQPKTPQKRLNPSPPKVGEQPTDKSKAKEIKDYDYDAPAIEQVAVNTQFLSGLVALNKPRNLTMILMVLQAILVKTMLINTIFAL